MYDRRIFNYELQPEGKQTILMPTGSDVIGVTAKYGFPFLLAVVPEDAVLEPRVFRIVTTGEVFNYSVLDYIGTLRLGGEDSNGAWYTMHIFEVETALSMPEHHAEPVDPRNGKYRADLVALSIELKGKQLVERDDKITGNWPEDD